MPSRPSGKAGRSRSSSVSREALEARSEEHTSELQSQSNLVCRLLLEKKKKPPLSLPVQMNDYPLGSFFVVSAPSCSIQPPATSLAPLYTHPPPHLCVSSALSSPSQQI